MKRCPTCTETKPLDEFPLNAATPTGFNTYCKPCHAAATMRRRAANRERDREIRRQSYRRHASRIIAEHSAARIADPEKFSKRDAEVYERRTSTPEGRKRWRAYQLVRAARKRGLDGALVENIDRDVVFDRDAGVCGICSLPVDPADWHLDHVMPLSKGGDHTYLNVQVAHPACNWRKHARLPDEIAIA